MPLAKQLEEYLSKAFEQLVVEKNMSDTYQTDLAIKLDGIKDSIESLANAVENSTMTNEELSTEILEIISDLTQVAYEFAQR